VDKFLFIAAGIFYFFGFVFLTLTAPSDLKTERSHWGGNVSFYSRNLFSVVSFSAAFIFFGFLNRLSSAFAFFSILYSFYFLAEFNIIMQDLVERTEIGPEFKETSRTIQLRAAMAIFFLALLFFCLQTCRSVFPKI
jgi:hypothetical protein